MKEEKIRAFLDTNVLVDVISNNKLGKEVIKTLRDSNIEIVTFRKCIYELYSILKGTTKEMVPKKNNPLRKFAPQDIYDIGQKIFKKTPDIDELGNTYYWYNLCEEWQGWDYFSNMESNIDKYVNKLNNKVSNNLIEKQKDFLKWKVGIKCAFNKIDSLIKEKNILVCEYFQIFTSDWYKRVGYFYEQEFAQNSLLPNEDFEIIISALFLNSKLFITKDDKGLIWRGGLSMGLNVPLPTFCCPERVKEAINDNFELMFYRLK